MGIRTANVEDWQKIYLLLNQLDYPNTDTFIKGKIETLLIDPNEELLVYEEDKEVMALISIHFIPQLAVKGDFALSLIHI